MKKHLFFIIAAVMLLASCNTTKKITYFQDIQNYTDTTKSVAPPAPEIRLRPDDKISVIVNSRDPELTNMFNLAYVTRTLGSTSENTSTGTQHGTSGYVVKRDGTIDFPVLGSIIAAGKTREELSAYIKNELISQGLVSDPIVTVEFINLQFSVMGEVKKPGSYNINRDYITLLDALSMAGDMTISGKRENVLVLRPDSIGKLTAYTVDMRSFAEVQNSPVYYIHQNDYIYVEPNRKKANESTVNANTVQSAAFWISVASFLASIASTISVIVTRAK